MQMTIDKEIQEVEMTQKRHASRLVEFGLPAKKDKGRGRGVTEVFFNEGQEVMDEEGWKNGARAGRNNFKCERR